MQNLIEILCDADNAAIFEPIAQNWTSRKEVQPHAKSTMPLLPQNGILFGF
jgi:hypothetical protein